MKYTIEAIIPNVGFTWHNMTENGDYEIQEVGEYDDLEDAIRALEVFRLEELKKSERQSDFDLRHEDGVLMGTIAGRLFID